MVETMPLKELAKRVLHEDALVPDEEPRRLPMWLRDILERHMAYADESELDEALARVRHYLCAALPHGEMDSKLARYGF